MAAIGLLGGGLWLCNQPARAADQPCNACCDCCPHCGCRLEKVCHIYCTTKKVVEYKYCCECKDICIPGVTPLLKGCCGNCQSCCEGGHCCARETHKLLKYPVTKEVPVRQCTVEWVCPNCSGSGQAPSEAPAAPAPAVQPRQRPSTPLPPPRTTEAPIPMPGVADYPIP
jgi:hypothetical protein